MPHRRRRWRVAAQLAAVCVVRRSCVAARVEPPLASSSYLAHSLPRRATRPPSRDAWIRHLSDHLHGLRGSTACTGQLSLLATSAAQRCLGRQARTSSARRRTSVVGSRRVAYADTKATEAWADHFGRRPRACAEARATGATLPRVLVVAPSLPHDATRHLPNAAHRAKGGPATADLGILGGHRVPGQRRCQAASKRWRGCQGHPLDGGESKGWAAEPRRLAAIIGDLGRGAVCILSSGAIRPAHIAVNSGANRPLCVGMGSNAVCEAHPGPSAAIACITVPRHSVRVCARVRVCSCLFVCSCLMSFV